MLSTSPRVVHHPHQEHAAAISAAPTDTDSWPDLPSRHQHRGDVQLGLAARRTRLRDGRAAGPVGRWWWVRPALRGAGECLLVLLVVVGGLCTAVLIKLLVG